MTNIIIPIYHSRETLPYCLDSLVAQTKKRFLIIIVNDADGEDYSDIIEEYKKRGLIISYIEQKENKGPGVARQAGVNAITNMTNLFSAKVHGLKNQYVMFLDSDDMLMPRAVELLTHEISINDLDVVSSSFIVERKGNLPVYMNVNNSSITWCIGKIYKLEYLIENKIEFDKNLRLNEDSYFNLVAMNCTKKKGRIEEYLGLVRDNKKSLTRDEENGTFFEKSADQYIISQIKAISKILDVTKDIAPATLAMTFINIYKHMMKAFYFNIPIQNAIVEFKRIQNNAIIQQIFATEDFWNMIANKLPACELYEEHLIFYKETFIDWLKEYVGME